MQLVTNLDDASDIRRSIEFLQSKLGPVAAAAGAVVAPPAAVAPVISAPVPTVTAPPPANTPTVSAGERDVEGLPWDERIHASTKSKIESGAWRRKKGVDDAQYNAIKAQILASLGVAPSMPVPSVPAVAPIPPVVAAPVAPTPPPSVPPPPPVQAPAVLPPPFPPDGWTAHPDAPGFFYKGQDVLSEADLRAKSAPAATAAPAAGAISWNTICEVMNRGIASGKVTMDTLNAIAAKYGVTPFAMLSTRHDLLAQVHGDLLAAGA